VNKDNFEVLKGHRFNEIQEKIIVLSSLNVCNLVAYFKHRPSGGYSHNILELKSRSHYDFIQECCFQGQISSQKAFFSKMFVDGVGSGVGLVARM
jgi:hypothetical protein